MNRSGITIQDVASRAGVSRSSVSRYLNGATVREAKAIADAVADLSYEPSPIARSLRSGRTQSVGVVVADVANPFFAAVFKGIEAVTRAYRDHHHDSVQLFLCNTEENPERLLELLDGLSGRVDGLIIAPPIETAPPEELLRQRVPVVLLDREFSGEPFADTVLIDNEGGMAAAVRHLASLGHRRIGLISGPLDTTPGRRRHEGYLQGLREAGLETPDELVAIGDFRKEGGHRGTAQLLTLDSPPTAIVAGNNMMALGALEQLAARDMRVPNDVSFVGFDDLEEAALLRPAISTVSRPMAEQGSQAMSLLLERLRGEGGPPRRIVLPTKFVDRESTGAPPGAGL